MDTEEKIDPYQKLGFEHGYWLQKGGSKDLAGLMERANKSTTYYEGLVAGKKEAEKEIFHERLREAGLSKDRDKDHDLGL